MIKRRYHFVFAFLRPFFSLFLKLAYGYRCTVFEGLQPDQPALILANHNGALDPFFVAGSFKRPIFYVASDHIFRLGWVSKAIRYLVNPIPIVKSQLDLRSLRQIRETIQAGGLVGLFPEGNRSFTGQTTYIPPSTGKLVKQLRCAVILYRLDGGYLTTPRWARYKRKGYFHGQVVAHLDPQTIAALSPEALYDMIRDALYVDAFADQEKRPVPYRGRKLAESLERVLFICPRCRSLTTLVSKADRLSCTHCQLAVRYTRLGFFEPLDDWSRQQHKDEHFLTTVAAWDHWQRAVLPDLLFEQAHLDLTGKRPLFEDQQQRLVLTERASRSQLVGEGTLQLYADRLSFHVQVTDGRNNVYAFPIDKLTQISIHGPQTLQFTTKDDQVWEVRSRIRRSAYKYLLVFHVLQQRLKGEPYGLYRI